MTLRETLLFAMASELLLAAHVKHLILIIFIGLLWNNSAYSEKTPNKPIAMALCKLHLETIELLRRSEYPEQWTRISTAAVTLDSGNIYVDRSPSSPPSLNMKYFDDKVILLEYLHSRAKARMMADISQYVISQTPPRVDQSLMDYMSTLVSLEIFYSSDPIGNKDYEEVATLHSVNHLLNVMTLYDTDLIVLLLAELEVRHPDEFTDFKNSSEVHALYNIKVEMRHTKGKSKRQDIISDYRDRRRALYHRLASEGKFEELYAAEGMFGLE